MNLADITTKCYILALIIRDDGERLLLGDGAYEFKDSQQHFIANTYANDVVELQGTDGQMLAGQVRRTATQTFAGYIGDATFSKQKIEAARRDFLMFFRKKHYYTAVYVFSDGTAIQRDRGYIVNAPSVPELYQRFPEWSVGLNFEDPNYYEYAEDDLGHEIAAHKVELELSTAMSGGLIWDGDGAVSDDLSYVGTEIPGEGKNFQLANTGTATLKSAELLGDAEQTTYSGKNLFNIKSFLTDRGVSYTENSDGSVTFGLTQALHSTPFQFSNTDVMVSIQALITNVTSTNAYIELYKSDGTSRVARLSQTVQKAENVAASKLSFNWGTAGNVTVKNAQLELGSTATAYEPYVGGTASPNPDYPQAVNTVTGEQTVKIEGKNLFDINSLSASGITIANDVASGTASSFYSAFGSNGIELPHIGQATLQMTGYTDANQSSENTSGLIFRLGYTDGTYSPYTEWKNNDTTPTPKIVISANGKTLDKLYILFGNKGQNIWHLSNIQLELGSTATTYEPYQGQTKTVNLGKNLFDKDNANIINAYINGSNTLATSSNDRVALIPVKPNTTYSITAQRVGQVSGQPADDFAGILIESTTAPAVGATGTRIFYAIHGNLSQTFTTNASQNWLALKVANIVRSDYSGTLATIQLELGQPTSFSPYFTPIELAKIGNYQDYIFNDNGTWKIHKAVGKKVLDGTENWDSWGASLTNTFSAKLASISPAVKDSGSYATGLLLSNYWTEQSNNALYNTDTQAIATTSNSFYIRINKSLLGSSNIAGLKTWLGTNKPTVYYALATPTTTEITNSELVEQLERLRHSHTYADTTNFSITATSPNLPAFLKVVAFGDDAIPQGGYVWEDGGTGGATTITVDGVDNAQPIWTVVGPATNPSLTNITTGESIQWTGVVPNGQTLVVNMADMTASLSGANVFEFISGSWITLQAGNNRVSYSATAATGIATLEWNGVVG